MTTTRTTIRATLIAWRGPVCQPVLSGADAWSGVYYVCSEAADGSPKVDCLQLPGPRAAAIPGPAAATRLGLTRRELEVLRHTGTGRTADATGRLLGISGRTVRKHLENSYRKLGCHDRLLAVQRARDLGLIEQSQISRPLLDGQVVR